MKKALSLLIVVCLIATMLPVAAFAAESGSCGANATWTLDGSTLTISGTGSTEDYKVAEAPWYRNRTQVRTIVVEEGITRLGDNIFAYTTDALEARLPATLQEIGANAFMACNALKRADLPEGLKTVRESAFKSCKALEELKLPQSLENLEPYAFSGCGMREVTIPESITLLPEHCFERATKLEKVTFHEGVTKIDDFCFSICESLKTVDLPDGLDEISWGCFSSSALQTIEIPEGVRTIDSYAFADCADLREISIPNTVKVMEQHCLRGTESLKTVDLPDGLNETGWGMFQHGGLQYIELPEGMTKVAEYTFCECDSLETVIIPDTVRYMEDYCFRDCDSLTTVDLPGKLAYLSWGMFQDSALQTLVIPDSVSFTEDYVFAHCDDLRSLTYPEGRFTFGDYAFAYCDGPETFDLPAGLTDLSWGMFTGSTLAYIDIPESVSKVEDYAFSNCDYLTEVVFPDGISVMGDYVFRDCDGIESVHLPTALKRIPWGCFWNSSIPELEIHEGVTEIGNQAFWDAYALTKLVVPASVKSVGNSKVFDGADSLVIYCWKDSFIHRYAEEHEIPYVLMDEDPEEPTEPEPTEPEPTEPEPTEPEPTEPEPTEPEPTEPEPTEPEYENPFADVAETDFYYDAVLWALEEGVTSGTSENTFSPYNPCQRAQVVTFLWRAMGCPEPVSAENPFTDVKETDFYYKAVLWAVEQGITNGMTANTFGPYGICNRAQVVTFLHRALGKPSGPSVNPFGDVKPGDYYYDAVLWAVGAGVTSGVDASVFGPGFDCVRGQVVTFLYRALAK